MSHFLLTYADELRHIKLRLLDENSLGTEIPLESLDFLKKTMTITYRPRASDRFNIFEPIYGTPGNFDFKEVKIIRSSKTIPFPADFSFKTLRSTNVKKMYDLVKNISDDGGKSLIVTDFRNFTWWENPLGEPTVVV